MAYEAEPRRCPVCGLGTLVDIAFREGSTLAEGEAIQESDTRQVETYSCGHSILGSKLSSADTEVLDVEQRRSEETVTPLPQRDAASPIRETR